ncbi:hypothetical protein ALC62_02062 [Cyphomyrmex costatus]|uniref:ISXO2-like transposase domain-containing protein n=1 Tax=Cyphomyrmex costatus TaxID=456900 RepID=A0A151INC6_9HYME|nr:hypothetical protein ALC62_02062 [Cyphomyrmex costatus]
MLFCAFIELIGHRDQLIDFLIQHGVLPSIINCEKCENKIHINKETLIAYCRKRYYLTSESNKKKRVYKQCNFKKSAKIGTWFNRSKLSVEKICTIVAFFLMLRPPRQEDLEEEFCISSVTVVDWFNFCREVCVYWADKHSSKLGGPGCTVKIDEAKIGHRKYNRGRLLKGNWIFGGFERESKKIFIMPVENRSEETLLACIKYWIMPGTTIISDCWKSYQCLNNEGFQHLTVNHTYNFVDPDSGKKKNYFKYKKNH